MLVCSACHQRVCWEGMLMCDNARSAGTVEVPDDSVDSRAMDSKQEQVGDEKGDEVVAELLDAIESWVDERVRVVTALHELKVARERTANMAKQSVEISLRKALHAASHGRISRVPTLLPRPGSGTMNAVRLPLVPPPAPASPSGGTLVSGIIANPPASTPMSITPGGADDSGPVPAADSFPLHESEDEDEN